MEQYVYLLMSRDVDELTIQVFAKEEDALATLDSERKYYENELGYYVVGEGEDMFRFYIVDEEEKQNLTHAELCQRDATTLWVEQAPFIV